MTTTGPLAGKTALITGADAGIGKTIAKTLAGQGAQVVIQHPHSPESAADVVKEITHAGGSALALAADLGDRTEYEELIEALLAECGHWDVLVHTTATALTAPLRETTEEQFDLGFAASAKAVFHGLQLAAAHLAEGGRVITIGGSSAPGNAVDNAATNAVAEFTRSLAADFAPRRITVNAVSSGTGGGGADGRVEDEHPSSNTAGSNLRTRLGADADITEVVAFLVSAEAEDVSAEHIRVAEAVAGKTTSEATRR
ncbi:3-oxoacyl-[acyl-carrier protein] reductase [Nocardia tenerifensis]|uniref:3-oxoacyl-[acyl-carrier protein] reductase n=1 Tax=Nocardia tenerifensis TaxID=228006 RepID=A0A318KMS1_9NOCA|nr:SDR family oxidoreductase [Nocardia tenerifensis]PXX63275.1 3-oxoacyl-[acyl-carrier protein] reductase [Nocardia tenerifensis]